MGNFFNLDGTLYRFGAILADMLIIGVIWLLCSIPVVTAGAATSSAYYVMTRRISEKEGYLVRDFFKAFKRNFWMSTALWLLFLGFGSLAFLSFFININNPDVMGNIGVYVAPIQLVLLLEIFFISFYMFPIVARFQMSFKQIIKSSFFMSNRHLLTSILLVGLFCALLLLCYLQFPFVLMAGGIYTYLASYLLIRIFRKYRPEMDRDEQELEQMAEEKRLMEEAERKRKIKAQYAGETTKIEKKGLKKLFGKK